MSGHQHDDEHALEDEAGGDERGDDQDAEPSLNAPDDAGPSGVVAETGEDQDET